MGKINKIVATGLLAAALLGGTSRTFGFLESIPKIKGNCQKVYNQKDNNIEYYTDEKGNIRKRKVKR